MISVRWNMHNNVDKCLFQFTEKHLHSELEDCFSHDKIIKGKSIVTVGNTE